MNELKENIPLDCRLFSFYELELLQLCTSHDLHRHRQGFINDMHSLFFWEHETMSSYKNVNAKMIKAI